MTKTLCTKTKENLSTQDWNDFIVAEFIKKQVQIDSEKLFSLRESVYKEIERHRGKPLLVYVTKFLEDINIPQGTPNIIDLPDVDGFTDLVNSVKGQKSVDVLLHSPGGRTDAAERLVQILRSNFDEVNFLIPHSAYSAATMLALSGDSIVMHPSAVLGPIDPQINGIPARSIKRGFENVKERISKDGPETLPAYIPLIEKFSIELLEICDDSENLAKKLASDWLKKYMMKCVEKKEEKIKDAVEYLSNYDEHLLHSRPLSLDKLKDLGLNIELADEKLKDLLWEAHILLNGFFNVSPFVKLYENSHGVSWGRSQIQQIALNLQQKTEKKHKDNSSSY